MATMHRQQAFTADGEEQRIAQVELSDRLALAIDESRQLRLETARLVSRAWIDLEIYERSVTRFSLLY